MRIATKWTFYVLYNSVVNVNTTLDADGHNLKDTPTQMLFTIFEFLWRTTENDLFLGSLIEVPPSPHPARKLLKGIMGKTL